MNTNIVNFANYCGRQCEPAAACIFDLDGTLLDSMYVWEHVDEVFFARRGMKLPEDYSATIAHMAFQDIATYTIETYGLTNDTPEDIMREWNDLAFECYAHEVTLKEGADEYLEMLHEHNIALAVATTLDARLRNAALQHHGIGHLFSEIVTTTDVGRGKDYPDVYAYCARQFGVPYEQCVVFEDILPGIQSAQSIGMRAWAVQDPSSEHDWNKIVAQADGWIRSFYDAPKLW